VQTRDTLEALKERYEQLVLQRSESCTLSKSHRRSIADKFANKSLQELHELAHRLDNVLI
jgi:hypothetical protein